jgi:hypothetical protein
MTGAGFFRATPNDPWPAREAIRLPGLSVFSDDRDSDRPVAHLSPCRLNRSGK